MILHWLIISGLVVLAPFGLGGGPSAGAQRYAPREAQGLVRLVARGREGERNRAAQRLYHLQDGSANGALLKLARSVDPLLRQRGMWALAVVRPGGAGGALLRGCRDRVAAVRRVAVVGVGSLRPAGGVKVLSGRLGDGDAEVAREAVRALARYGSPALPFLERAACGKPETVALLAVAGLGSVYGKQGTRSLVRVAGRSRDERVRLLTGLELQRRLSIAGVQTLAGLLRRGRELGVRLQAAEALGQELSDHGVAIAQSALAWAAQHARSARLRQRSGEVRARLRRPAHR